MGILEFLFPRRDSPGGAIVTDVTRMHRGRVCVAIERAKRTIRISDPSPTEAWVGSLGGLLPGTIVSFNWRSVRRFHLPHSEDASWSPSSFKKLGQLSREQLIALLMARASSAVTDAFGEPYLFSPRGNPGFRPNQGQRSLASIVVDKVRIYPQGDGLRADFTDGSRYWQMIPVEDLIWRARIPFTEFRVDHAIVRVGLGRPFEAHRSQPACYLQVNHVFAIEPATEGAPP